MSEYEEIPNIENVDNNDTQIPVDEPTKPEAPLTKPKRKHTVPQSQKQKENFEKARLKRAENIKLKKEAKDEEMLQKYVDNLAKQKTNAPKAKPKAVPKVIYEDENEDEDEEEIVIVKKAKKKAPAKKVRYVYESDDESEHQEAPTRRVNRSPAPKVSKPEEPQEPEDYTVYFA